MDNLVDNFKNYFIKILGNNNKTLKINILTLLCLSASYCTYNKLQNYKEYCRLAALRTRKQKERKEEFEKLRITHQLTEFDISIVELSLDGLILKLQSRELSAAQVLKAYVSKALQVTSQTNSVQEFIDVSSLVDELDELKEPKGPLHGVPFCIKDDVLLSGTDSTVGLSKNLYCPSSQTAVVVRILIDLGGVPFCRTNLPQTCLSYNSHNPIFGRTTNGINRKLHAGGSSSGTASLVASGGAIFGTGADTGGSLRVPSHFNGLSTIKASKNRLSRRGFMQCLTHCIGITTVGGLIAKSSSDIAFLFKLLTENNRQNEYDAKVVPIPWNEMSFSSSKRLRIGYFTEMDVLPPIGDISSTVLSAKIALESHGHILVPFELPNLNHIMQVLGDITWADLGAHLKTTLQNDEISPDILTKYNYSTIPYWKRYLLSKLPGFCKNNYAKIFKTINIDAGMGARNSAQLWDRMSERKEIIEDMLKRFGEKNLDLVLCPPAPCAAYGIEEAGLGEFDLAEGLYTFIWNLLDFPAGIVKFGTETGENIKINGNEPYHWASIKKSLKKDSIGMPIGVQLVGKPFHEEIVLRAMVELENHSLNKSISAF